MDDDDFNEASNEQDYSDNEDINDFNGDDDDKNKEEDDGFKLVTYKNIIDNIEKKPKKTIPYLTKFERARLIGTRLQQLTNGAKPLIDIKEYNIYSNTFVERMIAEKELELRKMPFIVRRQLPNGTYEDWRLEEFISVS